MKTNSSSIITTKSLFEKCEKDIIIHFQNVSSFSFRFVYLEDKNQLLIYTTIAKLSELNPRNINIQFLIILSQNFPYSEPIVLCKTNFTNPSLFDNRNLSSVLIEKWALKNNPSKVLTIISHLPIYVNKIDHDLKNSLLCYDGDYSYNYQYNINDFLINPSISIVKTEVAYAQMNRSDSIYMQSYLLITDLYLMILFPDDKIRNRARIVYQGEIMMIMDITPHPILVFNKESEKTEETVINNENCIDSNTVNQAVQIKMEIKWKDSYQKKLKKTLLIQKTEYAKVFNIINDKRQLLIKSFDYTFLSANNSIDEIKKIIAIREKELDDKTKFYAAQDLMELYQQIIELYSEDYKDQCAKYVEKLQSLVKGINQNNNKKG